MEADEEEREVATASAALFGGAEGEPRFDDDGMDGSDLPPSFALPLLTRGDEEEAADAREEENTAQPEKQTPSVISQATEEPPDSAEVEVDAQETETEDTAEQTEETADRRGFQCRSENCPKFAQAGGLCIAHGGGYRCQTPFCAFFNLRTCPDHGGSKRCGVTGYGANLKTVAIGLSMAVDARSTVARASAARVVVATNTTKEAGSAWLTAAASPVHSRTAPRSRSVLDAAVRMEENHDFSGVYAKGK
ncbi:uncharacterized protein KRP23_4908 [Phytophthora ramorum]|uniref:uncharacterized protein n=1 Tax=Phytophthora ramorum TaxID=164328 RepID=UPI003094B683|nr:hypothetical protein KRP23_4908 [Phytophthora ramorum]